MAGALLTGLGLAAPAGLNPWLPLLIVALAGRFTSLVGLGRTYDFLASTVGILVITFLLTVEVVLDKIPRIDHLNDLVMSPIRPAAGAILMMVATRQTQLNPVGALIIGLVVAGAVHTAKVGLRPLLTTATGGLGNPLLSLIEDALAALSSLLALLAPALVPLLLLACLAAYIWLWRRLRRRLAGPSRRSVGSTPSALGR